MPLCHNFLWIYLSIPIQFTPMAVGQHYSDVIMGIMASQITCISIICSTVGSGADQRKHQSSASLAFVGGNSPVAGEFPTQRVSNTENVSIWWRHHDQHYDSSCMTCSSNGARFYQHNISNFFGQSIIWLVRFQPIEDLTKWYCWQNMKSYVNE